MFTGSHSINMDPKGRMAIPTRVRDTLLDSCGGRLVMTAHSVERCLLVYPEPRWQEILPQVEALPTDKKATRRFKRLFIGYACPLELDGNGRVLVPPTLREYANLDKKLMLVGLGSNLELWSEESWHALLDESGDEDLPEALQSIAF